ncbi:MAG TPA: hypothetical protein VFA15_03935, partial [Nitrososphaera sp.]|nr:hypothetical protein [Nitrososphaera sp.]
DKLSSVILENVVRGELWNFEMQEDIIEASRLLDESIERSIANVALREFTQVHAVYRAAIVKADSFVSRSILLGRVMDEKEIDIAIAYTDDGKISIRRKDGADATVIDCSRIAQEFREGGGHSGAAGGFIDAKKQEKSDSDSAALAEITRGLESYFSKAVISR